MAIEHHYYRRHSSFKEITVKIQFPVDYPGSILFLEIVSKFISESLLQGLVNRCEQELNLHLDKPQVYKEYIGGYMGGGGQVST